MACLQPALNHPSAWLREAVCNMDSAAWVPVRSCRRPPEPASGKHSLPLRLSLLLPTTGMMRIVPTGWGGRRHAQTVKDEGSLCGWPEVAQPGSSRSPNSDILVVLPMELRLCHPDVGAAVQALLNRTVPKTHTPRCGWGCPPCRAV